VRDEDMKSLGVVTLLLVVFGHAETLPAAADIRERTGVRADVLTPSTYFVAPDGDDGSEGSSSNPWATIQRALNAARRGDRIVVRAGTYSPASFRRGGVAGAPIKLVAQAGVTLVGDGSGIGITAQSVSYVVIRGFEVTNFLVGIAVANASHVLVRGNTLRSNTGVGVQNWRVQHIRVESNRFLDPGPPYPASMNAIQDYGVNFYYARWVSVEGNYFFGKHNQALSFKSKVRQSSARWNVFEGCMYTCIYIGQNDDDRYGDMTSWQIEVRGNRFRDTSDSQTGSYYRCSVPIAVRNVRHASVRYNLIHPVCEATVQRIGSPQLAGVRAGENTIRRNRVATW
jgi:hypothetical protein